MHATKYRGDGESFREAMNRIAGALASGDDFKPFRELLLHQRFLPGGRIQQAVGGSSSTTAFNCFVSGTIEDSYVDGNGCIMDRAKEAAQTLRMGGGIGYDFSPIRPRGDPIRKLGSQASGPVSFMPIFNAVCEATASSGHRRGAQMGTLRIDHPDIETFIRAKQNEDQLRGFNVSVAVTDGFMRALLHKQDFDLVFAGRSYRTINPRGLWDTLMRSTWDWAEPGVIFVDRINALNNLWYCENICTTNPCGEQPLPPYGACLLGSFNLTKYAGLDGFNWELLRHDVGIAVRAMDNVIDNTTYPLYEQEKEAKTKRRMGLGVTGMANAIEYYGHPYGSEAFLEMEADILRILRDEAYRASAQLAANRGAFPMFAREEYLAGQFVQQLPDDVRDLIAEHGIRNSHLISIAPTGTISLAADNVSSGIEPVFAHEVDRIVQTFDGPTTCRVSDYGAAFMGTHGKTANEVSADEHLAVLSTAYKFVDSAVSKTCNVPADMPWEDFKHFYEKAWGLGCKGLTTYQVGGRRKPVIKDAEQSCEIDTVTGRRDCG